MTSPRIYVACLASYNNAVLYGSWIDADQDADDIREEVSKMLRGSPFPNVTVACPDCFESCVCSAIPCLCALTSKCATCSGKGRVPSAEEWAIHDYEGFEGIKLHESESFDKVSALATAIEEHGEAFVAFYSNGDCDGKDSDEWSDAFRDAYAGEYTDLAHYAGDVIEQQVDLSKLPDIIANYIDYESLGRDLRLGGDIWTADGGAGIFVFRNS